METTVTTETQTQASGSKGAAGSVEMEIDTNDLMQKLTQPQEED